MFIIQGWSSESINSINALITGYKSLENTEKEIVGNILVINETARNMPAMDRRFLNFLQLFLLLKDGDVIPSDKKTQTQLFHIFVNISQYDIEQNLSDFSFVNDFFRSSLIQTCKILIESGLIRNKEECLSFSQKNFNTVVSSPLTIQGKSCIEWLYTLGLLKNPLFMQDNFDIVIKHKTPLALLETMILIRGVLGPDDFQPIFTILARLDLQKDGITDVDENKEQITKIDLIYRALTYLQDNALLTKPIIDYLIKYEHLSDIVETFEILDNCGLLTQSNLDSLLHSTSSPISTILIDLNELKLLAGPSAQQNFDLLRKNFETASRIKELLSHVKETGYFEQLKELDIAIRQRKFNLIIAIAIKAASDAYLIYPDYANEAFEASLILDNVISPKNLAAETKRAINHEHPLDFANAFKIMADFKSTQGLDLALNTAETACYDLIRKATLNTTENIPYSPSSVANAYISLTQETLVFDGKEKQIKLNDLAGCWNPLESIKALRFLKTLQLLTPANFKTATKGASQSDFCRAIIALSEQNLPETDVKTYINLMVAGKTVNSHLVKQISKLREAGLLLMPGFNQTYLGKLLCFPKGYNDKQKEALINLLIELNKMNLPAHDLTFYFDHLTKRPNEPLLYNLTKLQEAGLLAAEFNCEYSNFVMESEESSLAEALILLHQEQSLDEKTKNYYFAHVIAGRNPVLLAEGITLLNKYLNKNDLVEYFKALIQREDIDTVIFILKALDNKKILTTAGITTVLEQKNYHIDQKKIFSTRRLINFDFSREEHLKHLKIFLNPLNEVFYNVFNILDADLFRRRPELLVDLTKSKSPHDFALLLQALKNKGLLKGNAAEKNYRIIKRHYTHADFYSAIIFLNEKGLLTQVNFTIVSHYFNNGRIGGIPVAKALVTLKEAFKDGITDHQTLIELIQATVLHNNPTDFVNSLILLKKEGLLTTSNYNNLKAIKNSAPALIALKNAGLLNKDTLNALIITAPILLDDSTIIQWHRLPTALLTKELFVQMINIAMTQGRLSEKFQTHAQAIAIAQARAQARAFFTMLINQTIHPPQAEEEDSSELSNRQSTHTKSVEKSTAESAQRLLARYQEQVNSLDQINALLEEIEIHIAELPEANPIYQAAGRCWIRLEEWKFLDVTPANDCTISVRQLLALFWMAIHDEDQRQCTLEEGKNLLVQALYELQRDGNINATGQDNRDEADWQPSCPGGTFNKLIEKLAGGVHPDINLQVITQEGLTRKFMAIVRQIAIEHMEQLIIISKDNNTPLVIAIDDDTVSNIWEDIREKVRSILFTKELLDEYQSLYPNEEEQKQNFEAILEAGQDFSLEEKDLEHLKKFGSSTQEPEKRKRHETDNHEDEAEYGEQDEDIFHAKKLCLLVNNTPNESSTPSEPDTHSSKQSINGRDLTLLLEGIKKTLATYKGEFKDDGYDSPSGQQDARGSSTPSDTTNSHSDDLLLPDSANLTPYADDGYESPSRQTGGYASPIGRIHEAGGAGNCLFHAVAYELNRQTGVSHHTHENLRARAVNYLKTNDAMFTQTLPWINDNYGSIENYLGKMAKNGVYTEGPIIQALAMCLNVEFWIHNGVKDIRGFHLNEKENRIVISLLYLNNPPFQHYQVVIPNLAPKGEENPARPPLAAARSSNSPTLFRATRTDEDENAMVTDEENGKSSLPTQLP